MQALAGADGRRIKHNDEPGRLSLPACHRDGQINYRGNPDRGDRNEPIYLSFQDTSANNSCQFPKRNRGSSPNQRAGVIRGRMMGVEGQQHEGEADFLPACSESLPLSWWAPKAGKTASTNGLPRGTSLRHSTDTPTHRAVLDHRQIVPSTRRACDKPTNHRILGKFRGKSWRPREPATGLACSFHRGEQLGPAAEVELR